MSFVKSIGFYALQYSTYGFFWNFRYISNIFKTYKIKACKANENGKQVHIKSQTWCTEYHAYTLARWNLIKYKCIINIIIIITKVLAQDWTVWQGSHKLRSFPVDFKLFLRGVSKFANFDQLLKFYTCDYQNITKLQKRLPWHTVSIGKIELFFTILPFWKSKSLKRILLVSSNNKCLAKYTN